MYAYYAPGMLQVIMIKIGVKCSLYIFTNQIEMSNVLPTRVVPESRRLFK